MFEAIYKLNDKIRLTPVELILIWETVNARHVFKICFKLFEQLV